MEPIEPGHETIINELEDVQLQIAKLWDVVTELRRDLDDLKLDYSNYKRVNAEIFTELQKDVDGLKAIWSFGQRMSNTSGKDNQKRRD
ncbi:MAG TPA: hypothetical protein VF393_04830 [archaeon]